MKTFCIFSRENWRYRERVKINFHGKGNNKNAKENNWTSVSMFAEKIGFSEKDSVEIVTLFNTEEDNTSWKGELISWNSRCYECCQSCCIV